MRMCTLRYTARRLLPFATAIVVLLSLSSCRSTVPSEQQKAEAERRAKEEQVNQVLADMATRYGAVAPDWNRAPAQQEEESSNFYPTRNFYTIEVEPQLVREDGRPILLIGSVKDIEKQGSTYFVRFQLWRYVHPEMPRILFIFESDAVQLKKFLDQKTLVSERYVVVATISSVKRATIEVSAQPLGKDEAEVDIGTSSLFIARGRCIDASSIGDYEGEE